MSGKQIGCLLVFCSYFCIGAFAQSEDLYQFNQLRVKNTTQAMYVLGGWAIGNIAISGIQRSRTQGDQRYFHEMNVFWNLVNLGIAGASLYGTMNSDISGLSLFESLREQERLEKILWFNVALNCSYIIGGFWLKERAKTQVNRPERLRGYGNSIILQGVFLLAFDLTSVLIHQSASKAPLANILSHIDITPTGIGLYFIF